MNPGWIKTISASKDVALVLSLSFNLLACSAIVVLWRHGAAMQKKVTDMLIDLTKELNRRYWSEGK